MGQLTIDLSKHEFKGGTKLFSSNLPLTLKNKNFIFAKNGSGKSTLTEIIKEQKDDEFDIHIFQGIESVLGEKESLNAVELYDSDKDRENKDNISKLSSNLEALINEQALLEKEETKRIENLDKQKKILDTFHQKAAKRIKKNTSYQVVPDYDKGKFKSDIINKEPKLVENLDELWNIVKDTTKNKVTDWYFPDIDFSKHLENVNQILKTKVVANVKIMELDDAPKKLEWARAGLSLHEDDEDCSFCGNKVPDSRRTALKSYFQADEVLNLTARIKEEHEMLLEQVKKIRTVKTLFYSDFYSKFSAQAKDFDDKINIKKTTCINSLQYLLQKIDEKARNPFSEVDKASFKIADTDVAELKAQICDLIASNNEFGEALDTEKEGAKEKIKLHLVKEELEQFKYEAENQKLKDLELDLCKLTNSKAEGTLDKLKSNISTKQEKIKQLKDQITNPKKLIEMINTKLENSGHPNLKLEFIEKNKHYQILNSDGSTRQISKISTGEKNVIAFLYFIGKLDFETGTKPKIIIFDDPMNSNDDTMQYLIITELQKLYRHQEDDYKKKFNPSVDYLVILTHNVHFYLNVQPHGSYPDKNGKTKYDRCGFFRLQNGNFFNIKSIKEDFKTHYDAIWYELQFLVKENLRNSMLNSMRRIIETYIEFNSLEQEDFYKGNEQYLKLFNVNSHSAIDVISTEAFTETPEELKLLFKQIFLDNKAEAHFTAHWKD